MNSESLFTAAPGLQSPWQVRDIQFCPEAGRIDFMVSFASGAKFTCPSCGEPEQGVHDTRKRTWRHLNFFQYQAFIHAELPGVRCSVCGKTKQMAPPWSRPGSGFSLLMKALIVLLAKKMPVRAVAGLLDLSDGQVWRIPDYYVDAARDRGDFSSVQCVGLDETASRRGHNCIPFHVMAIVNKANQTKRQQEHFDSLPKSRLKTARARQIKTTLQDVYQQCTTITEAEEALNRWYSWAVRSRLEPIKEAARTIRRHWSGILSWFDGHLNNGGVEGTNSIIQAAKARARGYGTTRHLMAISYLVAGKLTHLPAPPFITRCCG